MAPRAVSPAIAAARFYATTAFDGAPVVNPDTGGTVRVTTRTRDGMLFEWVTPPAGEVISTRADLVTYVPATVLPGAVWQDLDYLPKSAVDEDPRLFETVPAQSVLVWPSEIRKPIQGGEDRAVQHVAEQSRQVVVDVDAQTLTVLNGEQVVHAATVAVGSTATPTPPGRTSIAANYVDTAAVCTEGTPVVAIAHLRAPPARPTLPPHRRGRDEHQAPCPLQTPDTR